MLPDPDTAVLWVDSELFESGNTTPVAHGPKLASNAFLPAVAGGTGRLSITRSADDVFHRATDFDVLPGAIAAALRKSTMAHVPYFDREPERFLCQNYAIAGWSREAGRMLGWSFSAETFFTPMLTGSFSVPEVDRPLCWRPRDGSEILQCAREQARTLRRRLAGAGTGALTIATVQRGRIELQTIPEFDSNATRRSSVELEKMLCLSTLS
jgi:hypothetical protein